MTTNESDISPKVEEWKYRQVDMFTKLHSTPIRLWGQIVDQNGIAVPKAKIYYNIGRAPFASDTEGHIESDEQGAFYIENRGPSILIRVSKEGYHSSNEAVRIYKPSEIDSISPTTTKDSPLLFRLIESKSAVPLILSKLKMEAPVDGTPVYVDLLTGKRTDEQNARIRVIPRLGSPSSNEGLPINNWSVVVEGCGETRLQRAAETDELMLEAPLNGYEPALRFDRNVGSIASTSVFRARCYAVSIDGRMFGKFAIRVYFPHLNASEQAARIVVEGWINPAGTRNLEIDSTQQALVEE